MTAKSCIPFCRILSSLMELYPEFNLIASMFLEKRQTITKIFTKTEEFGQITVIGIWRKKVIH